jgi:hypothetical protein
LGPHSYLCAAASTISKLALKELHTEKVACQFLDMLQALKTLKKFLEPLNAILGGIMAPQLLTVPASC